MPETQLPRIIESIVNTYDAEDGINHIEGPNLPSRDRVVEIAKNFLNVLFPGYYEKQELSKGNVTYYIWEKAASVYHLLSREILKSLKSASGKQEDEKKLLAKSIDITFFILKKIPQIREQLRRDVRAAFEGDPAAKSLDEIIVSYPGIFA
jgi:serine O-acetyltransferase